MVLSVGTTLQAGKYRLDSVLDQHAFGATFLATHTGLNQQVVLKNFTPDASQDAQQKVQSFLTTARTLSRFHHPSLCRVSGAFVEENQAFMVNEFIQGIVLSDQVQTQPLGEAIAIDYVHQVALGLKVLHRHGLLHLNICPRHIIQRVPGSVVLTGLNSRWLGLSPHQIPAERHPYLSPDQSHTGKSITPSSEVYGLAATLYTLVTGQRPIPVYERFQTPLPSPRRWVPELSEALEQAILRGLGLDARDRPMFVSEWLNMLPAQGTVKSTSDSKSTVLQVTDGIPTPATENSATVLQPVHPIHSVKIPALPRVEGLEAASGRIPVEPALDVSSAPSAGSMSREKIQPPSALAETSTSEPDIKFGPGSVHPKQDAGKVQPTDASRELAQPTTRLQAASPAAIAVDPKPKHKTQLVSQVPPPVMPDQTKLSSTVTVKTNPAQTASDAATETQKSELSMDMVSNEPQSHRRFPKWTLFWSAVLAACGGLGAGLWFRWQISKQFAMPIVPRPSSELKQPTRETKEELFLPTNTSVIPQSDTDDTAQNNDPSASDQFDEENLSDPEPNNPEFSNGFSSNDPNAALESPPQNYGDPYSTETYNPDPYNDGQYSSGSSSDESYDAAIPYTTPQQSSVPSSADTAPLEAPDDVYFDEQYTQPESLAPLPQSSDSSWSDSSLQQSNRYSASGASL